VFRPLPRTTLAWLVSTLVTQGLLPGAVDAQGPTASAPGSIEIRIAPRDYVIAHEARVPGAGYHGTSPYYDLVVQTISFLNRSDRPVTLEGGTIELLAGGDLLQQTAISKAEMLRTQAAAVEITKMNFPDALDVEYSAKSLVPEGFTFSPTLTLAPRSVGLVDDYYLVVRSRPDQLRITARGRDEAGVECTGTLTVPIRTYQSKNAYTWPLEPGEWFVVAFPGLHSHHRWTATTEHGLDITMVDSRGSWAQGGAADWRTGKVAHWEDWYAYNKKVLAAAAGVVVKVVNDVAFPLEFWNRRAGETLEAYRERIGQKQMELFMAPGADAMSVAGGNHVVIRHANEEYSFYAHLAYGSVRVKVGQAVVQGEHIAGVGGTGEAPAVHLHFQVSDSPSMTTSRTFPVHFSNIHVNEQFADSFEPTLFFQPGFFITTARLPE